MPLRRADEHACRFIALCHTASVLPSQQDTANPAASTSDTEMAAFINNELELASFIDGYYRIDVPCIIEGIYVERS